MLGLDSLAVIRGIAIEKAIRIEACLFSSFRFGWKGQRRAPRALALRRGGGSIGTAYRRCAARGGICERTVKREWGDLVSASS